MRRPLPEVAYEALLPVGFRTQLKDLLLAHEVDRQRACDDKGEVFCGFAFYVSGIVVKQQRVAHFIKLHEIVFGARVGTILAIVQEVHIAFQEFVVSIAFAVHQIHDTKWRTPDGKNVHAAVIVTLDHFGDFGGATDTDDSLRKSEENTEFTFFVDAAVHHLAVTRLEDVQGESRAGKKNDVQWEKRNSIRPHECHS